MQQIIKVLYICLNSMNGSKPLPEQLSQQTEYITTEKQVIQECLRQASWSFNLFLALTTVSAIVSIVGIGLVFSGKISEGTATTAGGLGSNILSVHFLKLSKETNDRLYKITKEFKD